MIEPKKENVLLFKEFLEEFSEFQDQEPKPCPLLKIKSIYRDATSNSQRFYIIQKNYNKPLTSKLGKLTELQALTIIREICSFYYNLLSNSRPFAKLIIDPNLGIVPLTIDNISYVLNGKEDSDKPKLKNHHLKIDLLNFLLKKEESLSFTLQQFHLFEFQKLMFQLFFQKHKDFSLDLDSLEKEIKIAQKEKKIGIITRNLLNCLMNPEIKITWNHVFQHPLLKVDILLENEKKFVRVWEIDHERDSKIVLKWIKFLPNYEENKENDYKENEEDNLDQSDDEKTEKVNKKLKKTSFEIVDVVEDENCQNINVMDKGMTLAKILGSPEDFLNQPAEEEIQQTPNRISELGFENVFL